MNTKLDVLAPRRGRVLLRTNYTQGRYQHQEFAVREEPDGSILYYLGDAARTADGWVTLSEDHRTEVAWE